MFTLTYTVEFHAAHHLPDYQGKCARVHGHNWKADIECRSETLNKQGMVVDFDLLKGIVPDHQDLNEWMEDAPTTESVACEIYQRLKRAAVPVSGVTVWETERGRVCYTE